MLIGSDEDAPERAHGQPHRVPELTARQGFHGTEAAAQLDGEPDEVVLCGGSRHGDPDSRRVERLRMHHEPLEALEAIGHKAQHPVSPEPEDDLAPFSSSSSLSCSRRSPRSVRAVMYTSPSSATASQRGCLIPETRTLSSRRRSRPRPSSAISSPPSRSRAKPSALCSRLTRVR